MQKQRDQNSVGLIEKRDRLAAKRARLVYRLDTAPGWKRRLRGANFEFVDSRGREIRNETTLTRIRSLVIPPAWSDVWISPVANSHLQATGRDVRGRKQYLYHERGRMIRDQDKYYKLLEFAAVLPKMRRRVATDLRRPGLPREKILAAVVRLLETTLIRVGNDEYAQSNKSFGLTTMRNHHARVRTDRVEFHFRGKSGVEHHIELYDRQIAKVIARCQELPGPDLFEFVDRAGQVHDVTSNDVNEYIRQISGSDITAKEFRTWAGTVLAVQTLKACDPASSQTAAKRNLRRALAQVADRLGNTIAVCRKSYVHPMVIDAYLDRSLMKFFEKPLPTQSTLPRITKIEIEALVLLQQRRSRSRKRGDC